jgi:hypothetical protein
VNLGISSELEGADWWHLHLFVPHRRGQQTFGTGAEIEP